LWRLRTGTPWRDVPVWQLELDLSALPAMEFIGVWESVAIALAETMAESGHYNIDSTTVRAHGSAAGALCTECERQVIRNRTKRSRLLISWQRQKQYWQGVATPCQ
jgi:hypothetical protein